MKILIILASTLILTGCFESEDVQIIEGNNIKLGKAIFEENCMHCHGKEGEGLIKEWKTRLPNGKFTAPPLNGSAHAWHHSPTVLMNTVNNGGAKLGGWMPAFKDQLSEKQKQAVLNYIHDLCPQEVQRKYNQRFK